MLTELHIQNFAIIDKLDLRFGGGLIILTGETGAGKSIILDAVVMLIGGKADTTYVRTDSDAAFVEGLFHLNDKHHAVEDFFSRCVIRQHLQRADQPRLSERAFFLRSHRLSIVPDRLNHSRRSTGRGRRSRRYSARAFTARLPVVRTM